MDKGKSSGEEEGRRKGGRHTSSPGLFDVGRRHFGCFRSLRLPLLRVLERVDRRVVRLFSFDGLLSSRIARSLSPLIRA
jgi:hypothetical protein